MSVFLDLALVESRLSTLLTDGTVREIRILGSIQRAVPGQMARITPSLLIVPDRTNVSGPAGVGNGRHHTESFAIVVQVQPAEIANDVAAYDAIQAIREAAWDRLEGYRVTTDWSPLLYQGGQLLRIDGNAYAWLERYQTSHPVVSRPRS